MCAAPQWVVLNPGAVGELTRVAAAFDVEGSLAALISPFPNGKAPAGLDRLVNSVAPLGRELSRRRVAPPIGHVRPQGNLWEASAVWARRQGRPGVAARLESYKMSALVRQVTRYSCDALLTPDSIDVPSSGSGARVVYSSAAHRAAKARHIAPEVGIPLREDVNALDVRLRAADVIWTLSSYSRSTYLERGFAADKVRVAPLGVDTNIFRMTSEVLCRAGRPLDVLYAGRITVGKGLHHLSAAVATLRSASLTVVGSEDGSINLPPGTVRQSHMTQDALARRIARCDVFVLPSLSDAFGLTALQAMACGVAVVVSDRTFGQDLIRDWQNGVVYPAGDTDALAHVLESLLDDDVRGRLGQAARATALQLDWRVRAPQLAEQLSRWVA